MSFVASIAWLPACGRSAGSGAAAGYSPTAPPAKSTDPGGGTATDYKPRGLPAKDFRANGRTYAPMDMLSQDLDIHFDTQAGTAVGHSVIRFKQKVAGRPLFLLDATVRSVKLDGTAVQFDKVSDPENKNSFVALERDLAQDATAVAEVEYNLPSTRVSFRSSGVGFLTDMADLVPGHFFERWAPANLEEDIYQLNLTLRVDTPKTNQKLYTNGEVSTPSPGVWQIKFPANYNSSSFFVHLTDQDWKVRQFTYKGLDHDIPVTVYSTSDSVAQEAANRLPGLFQELESTYGPYLHPRFTALMTTDPNGGGMEYAGGAITSLRSLGHELLHSWFGRGVMPSDGRSGWIDEAMASWRDFGYQRSDTLLQRSVTNLAWISHWERGTPKNAYVDGRALLAELDQLFADRGGLKTVLKDYFARYRGKLISVEELRAFFEESTGKDLSPYFARYVYDGHTSVPEDDQSSPVQDAGELQDPDHNSFHPPTLTEDELSKLR